MFTDSYVVFTNWNSRTEHSRGKWGNEALLPHAPPWRHSRGEGKLQVLNRLGRNNCTTTSGDKTKVFSDETIMMTELGFIFPRGSKD